ncbi:aquaporin family protein [bacterium]|nr:aquaporin family protein [bacterium]MCP5461647.1 aquaporin family protein [bacterium]
MGKPCDFFGELLGTFILVFFGCGSVAAAVLFKAHTSLFEVAFIWGLAVTFGIYATRHMSAAHLNPAVSIAMVVARRMPAGKLPLHFAGQFGGAFLAAACLYLLLGPSIAHFEQMHGIVRGSAESVKTAMIFGEFYPNPAAEPAAQVSHLLACGAEFTGTFLLVLLIFCFTDKCNLGKPDDAMAPFYIGLTVTAIISIIAPFTQAGLNPARDLSPRLFAWLAGWKTAAFPDNHGGFLTVYVLSPCAAGICAALVFQWCIRPLFCDGKKCD